MRSYGLEAASNAMCEFDAKVMLALAGEEVRDFQWGAACTVSLEYLINVNMIQYGYKLKDRGRHYVELYLKKEETESAEDVFQKLLKEEKGG